jgi:hypothetical protein
VPARRWRGGRRGGRAGGHGIWERSSTRPRMPGPHLPHMGGANQIARTCQPTTCPLLPSLALGAGIGGRGRRERVRAAARPLTPAGRPW